uniref:Uncharacterized protein n=1 Tax=Arundo donax TaxID=35708 RepID=A0A0A9B9I1_ARUDO
MEATIIGMQTEPPSKQILSSSLKPVHGDSFALHVAKWVFNRFCIWCYSVALNSFRQRAYS